MSAANPARDLDWVLGRTPDLGHGAKLYETCVACHGARGEGVTDGSVPAIAGQPLAFLAKQIVDFRTGARTDTRMEHFSDSTHLSYSQEVADVAGYVANLGPRLLAAPGPAEDQGNGATLYVRKCERCHGAMAEGSEVGFAPRLAGQHANYLARQLANTKDVTDARPALKAAHAGIAETLSPADVAALAAILSVL